jgi:hypothetical protein
VTVYRSVRRLLELLWLHRMGFAESFVRTICHECLDHLLIVYRRHLEVVLGEYVLTPTMLDRVAASRLPNRYPARSLRSLTVGSLAVTSSFRRPYIFKSPISDPARSAT